MSKKAGPNKKRLIEWIRKNCFTDREEGKFCKILVRQVYNKKLGEEILMKEVPAKPGENTPEDLAVDILHQLDIEASEFGGMQHYACLAFFTDDPDRHVNRCIISIQGTDENNDEGLVSEAPDKVGLTAQAMRHQEANAKIMIAGFGQAMQALTRQNDRLMEMNEKLIDSRYNLLEQMTEVFDAKMARDIEMMKEKIKTEAIAEGVNTLKNLAPVVINKIAGKKLFPEPQAGLNQVGKTFYQSLTEEQTAALARLLSQEQLVQFAAIGDALVDADQLPQPPTNANGAEAKGK